MKGSTQEIEVKIAFSSVDDARRQLEALGMRLTRPRHFESNVLYDREQDPLREQKKLLRLRRVDERAWLTYKKDVESDGPYKIREEHESELHDGEAIARLLDGLGYEPLYRYDKYRTIWSNDALDACLDETPIGCYVEFEGTPEEIDAAAKKIGRTQADYIRLSYRDLHLEAAERGEIDAAAMVFPESTST